MYQSLIWTAVLRDDARGLGAPLHTKRRERLANSLVDGMRRNSELRRDLFRREELVDKTQAIELAGRQPRDPHSHQVRLSRAFRSIGGLRHPGRFLQG